MELRKIDYETSILLNKLDSEDIFNSPGNEFYVIETGELDEDLPNEEPEILELWGYPITERTREEVSPAPTQELLRKYFREKFGLHIELNYNTNLEEDYGFQVHSVYQFCIVDHANKMYNSYEDALEEALKQILEYLLDDKKL